MNFLGCDGIWLLNADGTTVCQGDMKTFTVQEMRDYLTPAMSTAQKVQVTSGLLALFVFVFVLRKLRVVSH